MYSTSIVCVCVCVLSTIYIQETYTNIHVADFLNKIETGK